MVLIFHILVAVTSVMYTTYVYFFPSATKLTATYVFTGITFATGTLLVFINPESLTHTCIVGIVYLAGMFYGILAVRKKLAKAPLEE